MLLAPKTDIWGKIPKTQPYSVTANFRMILFATTLVSIDVHALLEMNHGSKYPNAVMSGKKNHNENF